jgi:hypothetical protein
VITFLSRLWPRLVRPNARGNDTYWHLYYAERIRNNNFKIPPSDNRFSIRGEVSYPAVYHFILALFPKNLREQFEKMSGALFDTILVGVFYWCVNALLYPIGWSIQSIFILGLCFSLNPAYIMGMGTGPRAYQGTPRTLSELLSTIIFINLWLFYSQNNWIWMLVAILMASLLLNTSKFGGQVLAFFSLLMAFLLNSTTLLIFPFLSVLGAVILSKGHYYRILINHIDHLQLYAAKIANTHRFVIARKRWKWPTNLKEIYQFFIYDNAYGVLVARYLFVIFSLGLVLWNLIRWKSTGNSFLTAWLLAAFLTFLITSTPKFLFIGEAERYLNHAIIPAYLLFGIFSNSNYTIYILIGFTILHVVLYILHVTIFIRRFGKSEIKSESELIKVLNEQEPTILLSIFGNAPWSFLYQTEYPLCFTESLSKVYVSKEELDNFYWRFPLPRPDFNYYIKKYMVGTIAVLKRKVNECRIDGCIYNFDGLQVLFENEDIILYKVPADYEV